MDIRSKFFLAWRYFKPQRSAVSLITLISLAGVALGVAVLIVVLAVMTGFTDLMKAKLLETTSHIQIYDYYTGHIANPEKVIRTIAGNGIEAVPITTRPVLIQRGDRFIPKQVIGIDQQTAEGRLNLTKFTNVGKVDLGKNQVMISSTIADQLHATVGSKLLIHSPVRLAKMVNVQKDGKVTASKTSHVYLPDEFVVAGIYSFGKYDYDSMIVFINRDDANDLFELPMGSASELYVWVKDPFNVDEDANRIRKDLPMFSVMTWQEINKQLLGVLQVEKNMMFFLLVFIVLVAAFSITNTLITVVTQKTREIGLLKAIGASSPTVMTIFLLQGFFVGVIGACGGALLGITVIYYRNKILALMSQISGRPLFPPEFYYFNELPAHITGSDLALIIGISIILCTLGAVVPAWRAARLTPAEALRYE